jgi:catechol 2,3-dioxygenase-like lactoylglutathione lyase family enzyme
MAARTPAPPIDLNNPRLLVRDFAQSWKFYTKTLGLAVVNGDGSPPYGEVGSRDRFVGIFLREAMAELVGPTRAGRAPTDPFVLVFEVPNVDRTHASLVRARVPVVIGPTDRPMWGLRTIHLRDPDGNLVELYTRLDRVRPRSKSGPRPVG